MDAGPEGGDVDAPVVPLIGADDAEQFRERDHGRGVGGRARLAGEMTVGMPTGGPHIGCPAEPD
ncbi:Uncharacterised protein [Mycobacteroides abscessus subsp. abscessus]|nr:Uncharacterised protein [Mycobacteroides abscessus subsp. abscessus]